MPDLADSNPRSWREGQAQQLDYLQAELDKAIAEVQNVEAILELRGKPAGEARQFAALIRTEINQIRTEARELRRDADEHGQVLPMAVTTRRLPR